MAPVVGYLVLHIGETAALMVVSTAVSVALSAVMKLLTPSQKGGRNGGLETNYYNAEQRTPIVLGYARVGGMETIPPFTYGANGDELERIISIAGHEVSSYGSVMFDTNTVAQSEIGAITWSGSAGFVTNSRYFTDNAHPKCYLRLYRGTATDSADYNLTQVVDPTAFSANFRGRGIAKAYASYMFDPVIYQTGIPQHQFFVSGAKVYDPRSDSTNGGSGAQRYTDETTWTWSANPAVLTGWYLIKWGRYDPATEIDWPSIIAAANICDASVSVPGGSQARYTCNGMIYAHATMEDFKKNLQDLIDSMLGNIVYANGQWHVYAGAWQSTTFTINKADWITSPDFIFEAGIESRYNRMHCWFIDPARNWQRAECFPRTNDTYMAADGGRRLDHEFDQPLCTVEYEAQRKAEFLLRQSRNQIIVSGRLGPKFQDLSMLDTGSIVFSDLGWSVKTFRVHGFTQNPDGSVDVTFREEQSGDWADLASGDYNAPSTTAVPATSGSNSSAPAGLTVNTVGGTITASWHEGATVISGTKYQLWSSPFSLSVPGSKTLLFEGTDLSKTWAVGANTPFYLQVTAKANSLISDYNPSTYGVPVLPNYVSPSAPAGWSFDVQPTNVGNAAFAAIQTSAYATGTITNSAGASVFSWTNPSSVNIAIAYPGSRSTFFTGSGLASNETRAGNFWLNVVDGANTSSKAVYVSFTNVFF